MEELKKLLECFIEDFKSDYLVITRDEAKEILKVMMENE